MVSAPPSAELEPLREGTAAQTDEQDMGMTYEVNSKADHSKELAAYGERAGYHSAGLHSPGKLGNLCKLKSS